MKVATIASEKQWWVVALVMGLFAFALYANTIGNSYAMDDELVTRNHPLTARGVSAIPTIFTSYYFDNNIGNYYEYRPIVLTSFAIEHTIFGDNAHVSHTINALLYAIACMVLFFVIRSFKPDINYLFPALATIIFAALPIHTEVVASIKNRDEIFSFLFGISALFWAIKFARKGSLLGYGLFILFILLSVLSKRSVLSYTFIIPLAACWFSQASMVRLLSLSFPLMLISIFFSPIYEDSINGIIAAAIIAFPIVIWSVKTAMEEGLASISTNLSNAIKSFMPVAAATSPKADSKGDSINWLSFILLTILAAGALVSIFLDIRALVFICLGLLLVSAFILKPENKIYPLLIILLIVGAIAGVFQFKIMTYIAVGIMFSGIFFTGLPINGRILAPVFGIIIAAAYLFNNRDIADGFIDLCVILGLIITHNVIKNKKVIPVLLLVIGTMKLILEPQFVVVWVMNYLGAIYLFVEPRVKRPTALYASLATVGIVAAFALVVYPLQPSNPIYENNLGAYYKQLPDPYGDGEKTVTDIVPGAGREVDIIENPLVKETDLGVRLATSSKVMGYYVYLMVAPVHLKFYYGFNEITIVSLTNPVAILCLVVYIGLFVLGVWLYKRNVVLSFALLYLLLGLLFISNLGVLLTGIVAERLAFGTSLGYCMLLAWGLLRLFKVDLTSTVNIKQLKPAFLAIALIVVGGYSARTVVRNTNWKDKLTLYTHDANIATNSAKVQQMLGNEYLNMAIRDEANRDKHFANAQIYLQKSLAIAPKFHSALLDLGHLYSLKEDCKNAVIYLERFIAVSPPPPLVVFHYSICLDFVGRYKDAMVNYEKYVSMEPFNPAGYSNLSYLHFRLGNYDKSLEVSKKAVEMIPNSPDPYINVGNVYLELNMPVEAIPYYEKAYSINANDLNVVLHLWDLHSQIGDAKRGEMFRQKAIEMGHKF